MIATLDYLNGKGVLELFVPNAQDQLVTFYLYHFARSLMVLREYGVYYYKRPGSATDARKDKVRAKNAMMSSFTVVNTFYRNRKELTLSSVEKYLEYWFSFFIKNNAKSRYFSRHNEYFDRFITFVELCDFCDESFKSLVRDTFNVIF